jgi:outer membrane receptor protein involved in Fe transport
MKSCRSRRILAFAGLTALTVSPVASVHAQGEERALEEIVVTAAYRETGLQDVPVSVSAVTGETLTATAIQKAEDIQFLVPNFTLTETGIGTNAFVRGIGSGINQAFEQSVGTYVDGVHFGRAQQWRSPFLDVERVEVLRGPQSILFGKNSVAGAVSITTARPTDEFEASLMVSNEFEHNELIVEGMVSGPITERFRYRVAARTRDLDGHMVNATLDTDEPTREDWTVRAKLEFDLTDNLLATFKAEAGEFDVTGRHIEIINEIPGPNTLTYAQTLVLGLGGHPSTLNNFQDGIRSSNGDFSNNELENYVLTLDWDNGDYNFESITAWSAFEYDEFCDCDFTGTDVFGAALQETYDQFSQEFRLASPVGGNFDYIAGLYYQTSEHDFADQIIVNPTSVLVPALGAAGALVAGTQASRLATVDNDVLSVFAQFNFHFSDAFTLQLGGRYTQDERDGFRTLSITDLDFQPLPAPQIGAPLVYAQGFGITSTNLAVLAGLGVPGAAPLLGALGTLPVEGDRDTSKFSPEVKFIWNVDDNALFYASWSRGFKSGSFDFRANNRNFYPDMESSFEFNDEEATNIELGAKLTLADGAAEFNLAVFNTDYEDLQISIFDGILGFNVGNAASADILGLEADLRWAATDNLTISGGVAITDFEFTDFKNGQCYFGRPPDVDIDGDGTPELCDYTGNTNQMVSDLQGNLTFDYRIPVGSSLEFGALLDLFYTDEYHASATFDPKLIQDAYTMLNLRLALGAESGRWQIAVLGKNLTDEIVLSFGGDTPLAGSTFGSQSNYAFFGAGRMVTLQGQVRF